MKQIISIALLFFFLSNSVFKSALIFVYWKNKAAVIADCCINKNRPELKCEGKCYIGNQINKIDANTKSDLPSKSIEKDIELFVSLPFNYKILIFNSIRIFHESQSDDYKFQFSSKVFQPPVV